MHGFRLGWIVLIAAACGPKIAVDDGSGSGTDSSGDVGEVGDVGEGSSTPPSTTTNSPQPTSTSSSGPDPSASETAPVTVTTYDSATGGEPQPGVDCSEDAECASGHCYVVGILGGVCGECTSDEDCPDGGCTPPNPLAVPPEPSVCNTGTLGDGCDSDAVCEGILYCATVIDIPGVIVVNTCSQCRGDFDCSAGQLCSPMSDITSFSGVKLCVDPGSQPLGASCDQQGSGDQACTTGHCATADVMGLLQVGVCSECETDMDCPLDTQCHPPEVDLSQGYLPGYCQ
jgi:hypothetical protein